MGIIVYDPIEIPNSVLTSTYISICSSSVAMVKTGNVEDNNVMYTVSCTYRYWINKQAKDDGLSSYTAGVTDISSADTNDLWTKLYTKIKTFFVNSIDA